MTSSYYPKAGDWARGYGKKYNHLVTRTENTHGNMGTYRTFFACGAHSDFIQFGHDGFVSDCPKCQKAQAADCERREAVKHTKG